MGQDSTNGYIGIGRQTDKGSDVVPTDYARFLTGDINPENETINFREGGFGRQGMFVEKVGEIFTGTFDVNGRADIAGLLFTMALGADQVSGSDPYVHTITPAALQWWSIERMILGGLTPNEIVDRYTDCKLNALAFSGTAGDLLKLSVDFQGLSVDSSNAAQTPSYSTDGILKFLHGTFTAFGGATTEITSFTCTITNNLEPVQTGSLTYEQLVELNLDVTLDFTIKVTQEDEYRKVYYGSSSGTAALEALEATQVEFTFNNGLAAAAEREIKITIPELTYTAAPLTNLNADAEVIFMDATGISTNDGTNPLITVVVSNADTTAYDGA